MGLSQRMVPSTTGSHTRYQVACAKGVHYSHRSEQVRDVVPAGPMTLRFQESENKLLL
jgi:hypothetical protein